MRLLQIPGRFLLSTVFLLSAIPLVAGSEPDNEVMRQISAAQVPLEKLEPQLRDKVGNLLQTAPLFVRGPVESFPCRSLVYQQLLDNPDWVIHCWRVLGACKANITRQPNGTFVGKDTHGSELRWQLLSLEPGRRIWFVEGAGRPAPLMPMVQLKAIVLLRYQSVQGEDGRVGIRHRVDMFAQYDSKAVDLLSKLGGLSAEAAGKKVLEQVGLFYSGMAWYLSEHPRWGIQTIQRQAQQTGSGTERVAVLLGELTQAAAERPDQPTRRSRP
jgi:hypothetical protein